MAKAPKMQKPKSIMPSRTEPDVPADPRFADVASTQTRQDFIRRLNERHTREIDEGAEAVENLIWVGEMVEHAIRIGIINRGEVEEFVRVQTKYSVSYVRMGRRFARREREGDITRALALYRHYDDPAQRTRTGWRFKVGQPSGVVLVRDALKVLDAFENPENAAKTEQEKLRDIDERYPMTHPAQTSDRMTPNNRRVLLEAIAIYALAQLSRANPAAPILQNWSGPWMFLEWANQHVITAAEDKAQLEAHQIGRSMPWELVPDATTMDFRIAPDRDGTGEISDLIGLLRDELGEDEDLSDVSRQEAEDIADAATAPEPEEGSPGFLQYFNFSGELGMTEGVELTKKRAIRQSRASNPSMKPRHFRYEREGSGWRWQIKPPILRVVDLQRATGLTEAQRDAAGPQEDQTERSIGSNGNRSSNSPTD